MGDRLFTGCLNRFLGQFVAKFTAAAVLIELDIFKMTKDAGFFGYFKFLLVGFMLVAGGAVYHLAFDLLLFVQMRFMDEFDFFGELNLFGFEFIVRFAVTDGGHTACIGNLWSRSNGIATQRQVGKMPRWFGRDVTGLGYAYSCIGWGSAR